MTPANDNFHRSFAWWARQFAALAAIAGFDRLLIMWIYPQ